MIDPRNKKEYRKRSIKPPRGGGLFNFRGPRGGLIERGLNREGGLLERGLISKIKIQKFLFSCTFLVYI